MYAMRVSRAEFMVLLDARERRELGRLLVLEDSVDPGPEAAVALWRSDRQAATMPPGAIVVADGSSREWLAWIATYAPSYRPFTALVRVLTKSELEVCRAAVPAPGFQGHDAAAVGLVLGDVLSAERGKVGTRSGTVTASACASTLAYALVRNAALAREAVDDNTVVERWLTLRQFSQSNTAREVRTSERAVAAAVLRALMDVREGRSGKEIQAVADTAAELATTGRIEGSLLGWHEDVEWMGDAIAHMTGPREERVRVFERAADAIGRTIPRLHDTVGGRALGLLASFIGPGSLVHWELVSSVCSQFPDALLWYGLFAGLHAESSILSEMGGLPRRVLRDLVEPFDVLVAPTADISFEELSVVASGSHQSEFARTTSARVWVELVPGVTVTSSWGFASPQVGADPNPSADSAGLRPDIDAQILQLLEKAKVLVTQRSADSRRTRQDQTELFQKGRQPRRRR